MRRGRALAQMGEVTEAGRELTAARRMLDTERGTTPERLAYFTPAEIDGNAAACAMSLGRPDRAVRLLETTLGDYDRRFGRNRALYLVRLGAARLPVPSRTGPPTPSARRWMCSAARLAAGTCASS